LVSQSHSTQIQCKNKLKRDKSTGATLKL